MTLSIKILSIMTLSIMTLNITTLGVTTLSITKLSIIGLFITLWIMALKADCCYAVFHLYWLSQTSQSCWVLLCWVPLCLISSYWMSWHFGKCWKGQTWIYVVTFRAWIVVPVSRPLPAVFQVAVVPVEVVRKVRTGRIGETPALTVDDWFYARHRGHIIAIVGHSNVIGMDIYKYVI